MAINFYYNFLINFMINLEGSIGKNPRPKPQVRPWLRAIPLLKYLVLGHTGTMDRPFTQEKDPGHRRQWRYRQSRGHGSGGTGADLIIYEGSSQERLESIVENR